MAKKRDPSWQDMFRQLHDFHKFGNTESPPPKLIKWMDAQRRRYVLYGVGRKKTVGIIKYRIKQLNSIGFNWLKGEEARLDRDPRPRVILPPLQRIAKSSITSQQVNNITQLEQYSSRPPTSTSHHEYNKLEKIDRAQLLNGSFPEQLFRMVNDASVHANHLIDIGWVQDGSAFEIFDTKNVRSFIRRYFQQINNLSSMRRMLDMYSFSNSKGNHVFQHPYFHRDSSLADIKRNVIKSYSSKEETLMPPPQEPNNYRPQSIAAFPETLFNLVNEATRTHPHLIRWVPKGDAFEIVDPKNCGSQFIVHYFRHGKLSSLRRMLHLYNFNTSNNVYRNEHFHRDRSLSYILQNVVKK